MGKVEKSRADDLVMRAGLAESRTKAQALIMAGEVLVWKNEKWIALAKSGHAFPDDTLFKLKNDGPQDVGRGAQKLRGAFERWPELDEVAKNSVAIDVGSSTGGFTQVMLEKGAVRVAAVDVGTHQLHERLRSDKRVLSLEQTHILKVDEAFWADKISLPFDFAVMDVSFISVTRIIGHVSAWLRPGAPWIVLLKPQFELERKLLKKGIVKEEGHRLLALEKLKSFLAELGQFDLIDYMDSPIAGGDGNLEYLVYLKRRL